MFSPSMSRLAKVLVAIGCILIIAAVIGMAVTSSKWNDKEEVLTHVSHLFQPQIILLLAVEM